MVYHMSKSNKAILFISVLFIFIATYAQCTYSTTYNNTIILSSIETHPQVVFLNKSDTPADIKITICITDANATYNYTLYFWNSTYETVLESGTRTTNASGYDIFVITVSELGGYYFYVTYKPLAGYPLANETYIFVSELSCNATTIYVNETVSFVLNIQGLAGYAGWFEIYKISNEQKEFIANVAWNDTDWDGLENFTYTFTTTGDYVVYAYLDELVWSYPRIATSTIIRVIEEPSANETQPGNETSQGNETQTQPPANETQPSANETQTQSHMVLVVDIRKILTLCFVFIVLVIAIYAIYKISKRILKYR